MNERPRNGLRIDSEIETRLLCPKPYLSIRELSELTPWTDQAIRTMMAKGIFREGTHFFHVRRRPVFKWDAVIAFIERQESENEPEIPLRRGGFLGGTAET